MTSKGRLHLKAVLQGLAPYGGAALLLLALQRSQIAESLNLILYDFVTIHRATPSAAAQPIIMIGISEATIASYGWPIDDSLLCTAIDRLSSAGASAIGLDLYRDRGVGKEQECLRRRFRNNPRLVSIFNAAEPIRAVPGTPPQRQSFNDLVLDADGVVRRDLVHVSGQDESTVAFPMRLVEVSSGDQGWRKRLERGQTSGSWLGSVSGGYDRVDAAGYQQMLTFREPGSFHSWDLISLVNGEVPPAEINNRIVIIGSTAPSLKDLYEVPHSRFSSGEKQLLMTGLELQALRVASLLERIRGDNSLEVIAVPGWINLAIGLLAMGLGVALGEAVVNLQRSIVAVSGTAILLAGGLVLLLFHQIWIGTTLPLAGLVLMAGAAWLRRGALSQQHRLQIEKLLGQSTSPAVAKHLWEQREALLSTGRFEGQELPVTVLFSDTRNFTTVSERLSPSELLTWFNRGMALCVPAITRRSGMVNKFTGDGFLAVFGAPVSEGPQQDALSAVEAALEIQAGLEELNQAFITSGQPPMRMRIGMHSGTVLAGSMGSCERMDYAVLGDAVNCASRLESLDKDRHDNICRILVSAATRRLLPENWPLQWRSWGAVKVKGREVPLEVWELRGGEIRDSAQGSAQASPRP